MKRITLKQALIAAVVVVIGGLCAAGLAAWYFLPLGPVMDDGPFHGRPATIIPERAPDQSLRIFGAMTLEVYDNAGDSPIVRLLDRGGKQKWAVFADGRAPGDVRSIRFDTFRVTPFRASTVTGTVDWTGGREQTVWFITRRGTLRDYWYSW
jgi:hypothetical protein